MIINNRSDDICLHINCHGMGAWLQENLQRLGIHIENSRALQPRRRLELFSDSHDITLILYPMSAAPHLDFDDFVLERAVFGVKAWPPFLLDPFSETEASAISKLSDDYVRGQPGNADQGTQVSYFLSDARVVVPRFRSSGLGFSELLVMRLGGPLDWRLRKTMPGLIVE